MAAARELVQQWAPTDELTLEQACIYLKIKKQTMYNRIDNGTAPRRFKENGRWMFKFSDLEAYRRNERTFFEVGQ